MSAVLSDPGRKRSEVATFFSRHWGDSFVPPTSIPPSRLIPPVTAQQFTSYIKSTGKTYKKYQTAKKALLRQQIANDDKADVDDLPSIFVDSSFILSHGPTFSNIFTYPHQEDRDPLTVTTSGKLVVPLEKNEEQKCGTFRDYEQLNTKLEAMHDVVDSRLALKLVSKSSEFWKMVHSYGGLHEDLTMAMADIRSVRNNLKSVSELICERTRKIMKLYEKREQKQKMLSRLQDISCLRQAQATVQMMLNQSDYPKAIDCIETSLEVLESELHGVQCFRHLASQLHELYGVIGKMMHEDFAQVIQKELAGKPEDGTHIIYEGELSSITLGLMQVRKFSFIHVLSTEIAEAAKGIMRQVVKQVVVESGMDLTQFDPSLSQLGEPVRKLEYSNFLKTVHDVMNALFYFCERLQVLQDTMMELSEKVSSDNSTETGRSAGQSYVGEASSHSEQEEDSNSRSKISHSGTVTDPAALIAVEIHSIFHLRRVVSLIAEYGYHCAQQRICRLLEARMKDVNNDFTTPAQLAEIIVKVREYQSKCASRGWQKVQSLSNNVLSHCLDKLSMEYIDRFHSQRRTRIGEVLDMELWRAAEVPTVFQEIVNNCSRTNQLRNVVSPEKSDVSPSILIENEEFVVVGSVLMFIRILAEYVECVSALPVFSPDILSRIVELLKSFNSRCCQLILGTGALHLVGLRTISVRNLALTSRSLQFVLYFVPIVISELDSNLKEDQKHRLRHFKQVQTDYNDHINEISSKLESVIDLHISSFLNTWEMKGGLPSLAFQQICKRLQKFHSGMYGVMPPEQIKKLFESVHHSFKGHLKEHMERLGITPHHTSAYGFVCQDYQFYSNSIHSMECCKDITLEPLNEIIFGP
ncbi:unnamed protein product [Auanema sp. JU1783]|nr:unnamed protein product [Auanema sp. JU1783]